MPDIAIHVDCSLEPHSLYVTIIGTEFLSEGDTAAIAAERMIHLGVRHGRAYRLILQDLKEALTQIEDSYTFFHMSTEEWEKLDPEHQSALLESLADDVFYGLGGVQSQFRVGRGEVAYDPKFHIIKVGIDEKLVRIVHLI